MTPRIHGRNCRKRRNLRRQRKTMKAPESRDLSCYSNPLPAALETPERGRMGWWKMLRWGTLILGILFALPIAFYFFMLRDDPLTSAAAQALAYRPAPVPPAQNAFVAIAGFNAPAGSDFIRAGEENLRQVAQGKVPDADPHPLLFSIEKYAAACTWTDNAHCLAAIQADADNNAKLMEDNRELIARYAHIQTMPHFSNGIDFLLLADEMSKGKDWLIPYRQTAYVLGLLSDHAALIIQNGQIDEGLDFIEKDIEFQRKIFAAVDAELVDKLVALAYIRQHVVLLSLLMEQGIPAEHLHRIRPMLVPLADIGQHFREAMWSEHIQELNSLTRMGDTIFRWKDHAYPERIVGQAMYEIVWKNNMTLNLSSEFWHEYMRLLGDITPSRLSSEFPGIDERVRARVCPMAEKYFFCNHIRNFTGEALVQIGQANWGQYLLKIHDHDAHIRLVRAQLEYHLAVNGKIEANPQQTLATLGAETFNPYTGQPFEWNAERQTLGFRPMHHEGKAKWVEVYLSPRQPPGAPPSPVSQ
jgi:hypothetical protein